MINALFFSHATYTYCETTHKLHTWSFILFYYRFRCINRLNGWLPLSKLIFIFRLSYFSWFVVHTIEKIFVFIQLRLKIISCSDSIGKSNFFFYSFQIGKDQTQNTDTQIDVSTYFQIALVNFKINIKHNFEYNV